MRIFFLISLLFIAICARAQESAACIAFRDSVLDKPFIPRDYSGDDDRTYEMRAGVLSAPEMKMREFSFFTAEKVKCSGRAVTLEGARNFAVVNSATHIVSKAGTGDRAKIVVKVVDEPLETAMPKMPWLLFWDSPAHAVASVPDYVSKWVPAAFDPDAKSFVDCAICGGGVPSAESAGVFSLGKESGVTPPRLLNQVDPEFTEAASKLKDWHGASRVALIVGVDGKPRSVWLLRSAGYGLDQNAAKAVSKYRFSPSTKDGHPVAVVLNVEVDFTMNPK